MRYNGLPLPENPKIKAAAEAYCEKMMAYPAFGEIPSHLLGEAPLIGWLFGVGNFTAIPKALLTELIYEVAVAHEPMALANINPTDTRQYEALALVGLTRNPEQLKFIPTKWKTEDFIIKACIADTEIIRQLDWRKEGKYLVTKRLVNEIGSVSLVHGCDLVNYIGPEARNLLDDESIRSAIRFKASDLFRLLDLQALPVLKAMVMEGYWPPASDRSFQFSSSFGDDYRLRPASPVEAKERLCRSMGVSYWLLHSFMMKSFPIEDVIALLSVDQGSLDLLFRLYEDYELRPYMGLSRQLRGRLLEQEMGL
jgi:hypothetical protein